MSSCKSSCFVEEEEFGVTAGRHDRTLAAPKLQHAHEPPLPLPSPLNSAFLVMENATIAHERSSLGRGNDLTQWIHTVLPWHLNPNSSTPRSLAPSFPRRLLQFSVPETLDKMIVDHAHGLHEGVANGAANEFETPPFQVLAHGVRFRGFGWNLLHRLSGIVPLLMADEGPDVLIEKP
jgi:hypothetical protein